VGAPNLRQFLVAENLKKRIPWFIKVPAKIVLSRLPLGLRSWQHLNLFRAGGMDSPAYAWDIFNKHCQAADLTNLHGRNVLELGPGNSLLTALYARSFGAARTWLIDSERLAENDTATFARAEKALATLNRPVPGVSAAPSLDAVLEQLNAVYLTQGLTSLRTLPDGETDFLFSNAVLEHVALADFAEIIKQTRRVLKPTGVASHLIDFKDHLQYALNNLRFSERVWESRFMARSGFYTNRLTWPKMEKILQETGFSVELYGCNRWPNGLPTPQGRMAFPFRNMPPGELSVMDAHIVLRPAA